MKTLALIIDTLREIYAKKVIVGIIIIEILTLVIAGFILFGSGMQGVYRESGAALPSIADSSIADSSRAEARTHRDEPIDTALLGSDAPLPFDTLPHEQAPKRPSRTFEIALGNHAGPQRGGQAVLLGEMVKGQMGAFSGPIALATIFFGIFIMAGIVPALMEKGTIDLLLSKPISRTTILFSRALGGFIAIAVNLLVFLLILYVMYGLASGAWVFSFVTYGFAIPLFTLAVVYSGILLLNVITEGFVLPMILAYLQLTIVGMLLFSREQMLYPMIDSDVLHRILDGLYYILPQTSDLIGTVPLAIYSGSIDHAAPFIQGIAFSAVMYALAAWRFQRKDF